MFTGIVETTATVKHVVIEGSNKRFIIQSSISTELKVDQSVSHNGVCLTVEKITGDAYEVVAVEETLKRSNFREVKTGDEINLERSLKIGDRLDGHFVQGHVDEMAECVSIHNNNGSWTFTFKLDNSKENLLVEKGSVCVNGVSLTIADLTDTTFSVAVIPYTFEHTNFKRLKVGNHVNIEYDVIGKYVQRLLSHGSTSSP